MNPTPIHTTDAPAALGPYSQATVVGDLVFCSGQVALDPKLDPMTSDLVGTTAAEQTKQVLDNLSAVLAAAGSSLHQVAKTTIFLTTMADFGPVNEVYAGYFNEVKPARATVAVKELPKGALVEIDCIATR
jgi:2-iminobutanoate/2-iminopropanoate deaminase